MKNWQKWALVLIVVIGVIISVKSCVDKKATDVTAAYIGEGFVNYDVFEKASFENLIPDVNGDGDICMDLMEISFNKELGSADRQNSSQKMANAIGMGSARVYFIEEGFLINNAESGAFEDLTYLGDGFKDSSGAVVGISIRDNEKVKALGIDSDGEIYISVRKITELDYATDKNVEKKHKAAIALAEYILG